MEYIPTVWRESLSIKHLKYIFSRIPITYQLLPRRLCAYKKFEWYTEYSFHTNNLYYLSASKKRTNCRVEGKKFDGLTKKKLINNWPKTKNEFKSPLKEFEFHNVNFFLLLSKDHILFKLFSPMKLLSLNFWPPTSPGEEGGRRSREHQTRNQRLRPRDQSREMFG